MNFFKSKYSDKVDIIGGTPHPIIKYVYKPTIPASLSLSSCLNTF